MNVTQILNAVEVKKVVGDLPEYISGITANTAKINQGFAFIAVKGIKTDGHDLVQMAKDLGAILVIAENEIDTELPIIIVENTRNIWGVLALLAKGNPQNAMKLVGVTGTNGKTTVTTLVHQTLTLLGYHTGLMGTIATKIGNESFESNLTTGDPEQIAESLAIMKESGCTIAIMEVSSHALDQHRVGGLRYDVAVYTNLTQDHLDYHSTMDNYALAKKKLFDGLKDDAVAIINTDDAYHSLMVADCSATVWGFGQKDGSLTFHSNDTFGGVFELNGTVISTSLSGLFNIYNAASAYLVCLALGCSEKNASYAISQVNGAEGRLERIYLNDEGPVVFVDYAHTPDALKNVLETLQPLRKKGSLVVLFGCGGNRDRTKRPIMGAVAAELADVIYLTSDNPRFESAETIIYEIASGISESTISSVKTIVDRKEAIRHAICNSNTVDVVLIAGKGHETYQEVEGIRYPMDDRALASEALVYRTKQLKMQQGA